ncbi:MAG: 50S ribosomal protein L14e [Candidatus Hadarchaeales archaeon]
MAMDIGRVCVKLAGHEAGRECVIVDVVDKNSVIVVGPRVKRRRCNVLHLQPTDRKLDIARGCADEDAKKALQASG